LRFSRRLNEPRQRRVMAAGCKRRRASAVRHGETQEDEIRFDFLAAGWFGLALTVSQNAVQDGVQDRQQVAAAMRRQQI
jgi:hypothetical protein